MTGVVSLVLAGPRQLCLSNTVTSSFGRSGKQFPTEGFLAMPWVCGLQLAGKLPQEHITRDVPLYLCVPLLFSHRLTPPCWKCTSKREYPLRCCDWTPSSLWYAAHHFFSRHTDGSCHQGAIRLFCQLRTSATRGFRLCWLCPDPSKRALGFRQGSRRCPQCQDRSNSFNPTMPATLKSYM